MISISAVSGSWGGQITQQALIALAVFLVLVTLFLAFYFERAMAAAALVALVHDVVVTMGVYSIVGFEVTPATVIGLLTILGFSLYDTVVVFDKVKENTRGLLGLTRRTYAEAANLALNQTLMRSINTSLIAVLPVVGLLVVGVGVLGVGTLADLALVQLVGILAGALSSLLLATPLLVDLKMRDRRFQEQAARVLSRRQRAKSSAAAPAERRRRGGRGARPVRRRRARPAAAAGTGGRGGREHPEPRGQARPRRGPGPAHRQGVEAHRQAAPVTRAARSPDLARVRDLVRDVPDFPSPGVLFRDITPVLADAAAFTTVATELATSVGAADVVVGIEARGFLLGAAAALVAGTGVVPVRKAGKLPRVAASRTYELEYGTATLELPADTIAAGARVFVVDDVLATGGTAAATCALLADVGAEVVGVGVLLELAALGGRDRLRLLPVHAVLVI